MTIKMLFLGPVHITPKEFEKGGFPGGGTPRILDRGVPRRFLNANPI